MPRRVDMETCKHGEAGGGDRPASAALLPRQARALVADLLRHARSRGGTVALMLLGGVLEGVGLLVLVPLAGVLVASDGRWQASAAKLFGLVGATAPLAPLAALLAVFVAVMLARAGVLLLRDRRLAALSVGFVEERRVALVRALASARWQDVAGLRHARVTAALGSDVQKVAAAMHYLLQVTVAAVMLAAQWLLTLVIAPALAAAALVPMLVGGVVLLPSLRRVGGIGHAALESHARLMDASGQLLAGLKIAVAQNA